MSVVGVGSWVIVWSNEKPYLWGDVVEMTSFGFVLHNISKGEPGELVQVHKDFAKFSSYSTAAEMFSVLEALAQLEQILPENDEPKTVPQPEEVKPPQLIVTVTGHRPDKLGGYKVPNPVYDLVVHGLAWAFDHYKPGAVITGMGLGTDQWAAEICLNMNIPFVAAIPFDGQEKRWPPYSQQKYHWLLSRAAQKYVVSPGAYAGWKMQKRNQWMVDNCHGVIAVYNGTPGGTANCLTYATQAGKPIYYVPIDPGGMVVGSVPQQAPAQPQQQSTEPDVPSTKRIIDL